MLRTFIWLVLAVIITIISIPLAIISWLFRDKDKFGHVPWAVSFIAKNILPFMNKLGGCDVQIKGTENIPEGAALFVGNHQGDFDVLTICYAFGRVPAIIAKIEASRIPLISEWMKMMHCIFMDRKDMRQSLKCINEASEYLSHGISVVIFPEGTRSKGPNMGEFKHGAFKAAIKANVPVVPFAVDGTYKVFEAQRYLKKSPVTMTILPPIMPITGEKTQELSMRVQAAIQSELDSQRGITNIITRDKDE